MMLGKLKLVKVREGDVDLECGVTGWGRDVWQRKPCTPLLGSRTEHECVPAVRKESLYVIHLPSLVCMHQQVFDQGDLHAGAQAP